MSREKARVLEKPFNEVFNGEIRMNLREWRRSKGWSQEELAVKVGANPKTYGAYETGRNEISPAVLTKLRKMGFQGEVVAQEPAVPAGGPYATASEVAELRGAVKAHIDYWREGEGKVLLRMEELARRIEAIERRLSP